MTDTTPNPDGPEFETALIEHTLARAACASYKGSHDTPEADAIWARYGAAEEAVMALPAPDLEAVIEKVKIAFEDELSIETPDSIPIMRIIGDLRRLACLHDCGLEAQDL